MQGPPSDSPSSDLVRIGLFHLESVTFFEETEHLAESFHAANDRLLSAFEARLTAERSAAPMEARVPLIDVELDALLMGFAEALKAHDRAAGVEPLCDLFFPQGVEEAVAPVGASQATIVHDVLERMRQQPQTAELQDPWGELLGQWLGRYDQAIDSRNEARRALDEAGSAERKARDAWFEAAARNCEVIAEEFPDSSVTQDLFFPAD